MSESEEIAKAVTKSVEATEKSSIFNCPYNQCSNGYKTGGRFIGHLILKHDKSWKLIFVMLAILSLVLTILSPLYSNYVQYGLDKMLGKDIDFYLSVNSIYSFENKGLINITNQNEEGLKYLNKQVLLGLIPRNHNNKAPLTFGLKDDKTGKNSCLFLSYNNVNKFFPPKELEPDMREVYPDGSYGLGIITPTTDIIEKLENCEDCLGQLFYGVNLGEKNIDLVNFEICYKNEFFIEETNFEKTGDHCFRAKRENIIKNENLLGYVLIKDYNESVYYSLWENSFYPTVYGEYESKGISVKIGKEDLAQAISSVVPNCQFK